MHLKTGLYILCCSAFLALASCLGGEDPIEVIIPDDAELLSFSLSHDSISELAQTVFSIDQVKGLIYNHDSMSYRTNIYESVIVTYTNSTSTTNVLRIKENGDSIRWVASGDSLDFSQPVFLKVFSLTETLKTKIYQVQINIHQIDPDSVQYVQIKKNEPLINGKEIKTVYFNGKYYLYVKEASSVSVYQSEDVKSWQKMTGTGLSGDLIVSEIQSGESGIYAYTKNGDFYISYDALEWKKLQEWFPSATMEYPVKSILGFKREGQINEAGLSFILEKDGKNIFAFMRDLQEWDFGDPVPEDFPLSAFSVLNDSTHGELKLTLVGGIAASGETNFVWTTENGYYWIKSGISPPVNGANAFLYDNEIYLLNGKSADGAYNKTVYSSQDGGISWQEKPGKCRPSGDYSFRQYASLIVDKEGKYFYIIGGQNETVLTDIWQAYLNKKMFAN
jgi:hypothetical protein